ncbi:pseudouridine synthase domain protein, partial [Vibrio parahaemolyticus V-223/04]
MADRKTSLKHR